MINDLTSLDKTVITVYSISVLTFAFAVLRLIYQVLKEYTKS
jgi:hypothetical protein